MKLVNYTGWLLSEVGDDQPTAAELLRALREQSSHFDTDTLVRNLTGRSGPGGGVDAEPFHAAFVLLAVMLGGKRADIAMRVWRTWHIDYEGTKLPTATIASDNWDETFEELPKCELTGEHLFGEALKVILANTDLARDIVKVRIAADRSAKIWHSNGTVSRFKNSAVPRNYPLIRFSELDGIVIRDIAARLTDG